MVEARHITMDFRIDQNRTTNLKEFVVDTLHRQTHTTTFRALNDVSFTAVEEDILPPGEFRVEAAAEFEHGDERALQCDAAAGGRENIFLNGAILGYPKDFLHDKAPEIIAYSELDRFIDRPLKTYSSGMLARLAFSIATVVQPDILIVDEILAVGDERFQRKSRARMLELMSGGATVLFVSHNLSQIRELCDRVIWLEHGRIRAQGDAKSLCDAYEREAAP